MKLTPLDIKRHQFEKGFRGYDPDEVDGFLKQVADRFESLQEEIRMAQDRTREVESKLQHYERVEMALQEALESAKETARRSEQDAERRAAVIVEEAELRAQKITQEAERERFGMRKDLIALSARQAEVAARLRGFLMSELQIVSDFQGEDRHGLLRLDDAPELLLDAPAEPDEDAAWTPSDAEAGGEAASFPSETLDDPLTESEDDAADDADWADMTPSEAVPTMPSRVEADEPADADERPDERLSPDSALDDPAADEDDRDHVILTPPSPAETEPLDPDESGVIGPSRPVEASRAQPAMPADPWTIPTPSVASSEEERERIRRILEDLD